jgi:hypothetical protein
MNLNLFNKNFLHIFIATNKKVFWAWFVLISFFLLGLILRLECLEVVRINFWLTRDFDRAFNLFDGNYIPLAGPETTNGLRLPGPALYFLMAIPLWFQYSYDSIFVFYLVLNFSSLILTFWIIRKYFDFNTAFLATIYQLIHPLSIEGIAFPINPAFLLPIIPFLFWFVFEFALNKNENYFPLIILIVAIGIQIHLSIAVFLTVPILWALIFKIKISLKTIIKTFIVAALCFVPFFFYEAQAYKPSIAYTSVTKPDPFSSFIEPIRIIGVQNTIWRLSEVGISMGNMSNFLGIPKVYSLLTSILINCSFFGSVLFLIFNIRQKETEVFKRSLLVVFLFYLPALIYDLIRPWEAHFWYNYIFILPTALLLSNFFVILNSLAKKKGFQISLKVGASILVVYLTLFNTNYFYSVKRDIQHHVSIGDYKSFKPLDLFIRNLSKHFDIPLDGYVDQVYFEENTPFSTKLIKLMEKDINDSSPKKNDEKKKPCYYLFSMDNLVDMKTGRFTEKNKKLSSFSNDTTIQILASDIFAYNGKKFGVKKYYPKFNQPCYQNSDNVFSSTFEDKMLLDDYFQYQSNGNRFLERQVEFGNDDELKNIKIKTIYSNPTLDLPIRFQITVEKNPKNYSLRVKLDAYGWGKRLGDNFVLKSMDIEIENKANSLEAKNKLKFPIITPGSWIGDGFGIKLDKFSWYRQFDLPENYKFPKSELIFNISGDVRVLNKKGPCCENYKFPILVDVS